MHDDIMQGSLIIRSILSTTFIYSSLPTYLNGLREPVCALVVGPLALLLCTILCGVPHTYPMLHVVLPLPDVLVSVRENHCAISILLSWFEVTLVHAPIFVRKSAFALEQVVWELSFVCTFWLSKVVDTCIDLTVRSVECRSRGELWLTLTSENTIDEITLVKATIGPLVATSPIFLALIVCALKPYPGLVPSFSTMAMLLIIQPFAIVGRAFRIYERAPAIRHTIHPLALIDASVSLAHAP